MAVREWLFFVRGLSKTNRTVALAIELGPSPENWVRESERLMPYRLELAGVEEGSLELLERLRERFRGQHLHGPWYRPSEALEAYVAGLGPVDQDWNKARRITILVPPEEFSEIERSVKRLGLVTKSRLLRRAYRLYIDLGAYHARGYRIQAIREGKLVQFPNLDRIDPPEN